MSAHTPATLSQPLEPWYAHSPDSNTTFNVRQCAVQELQLQFNQIGDAGVTALANACASGSLASITEIYLQDNKATQVGKEAMSDVAKARGFYLRV